MTEVLTRPNNRTVRDAATVEDTSLVLVELTLKALSASTSMSVLQVRVLLVIDQYGPLGLGALAAQLEISAPSASRLVSRLVDERLILRRTPDHDRRTLELRLSAKGRRTLDRVRQARRTAIAEVLTTMTAPDRRALIDGLSGFASAGHAITAARSSRP